MTMTDHTTDATTMTTLPHKASLPGAATRQVSAANNKLMKKTVEFIELKLDGNNTKERNTHTHQKQKQTEQSSKETKSNAEHKKKKEKNRKKN